MIELGARMGGDCITTHLVPLSTGIDMIKATIDICLGDVPDLEYKFHKGSAIRYLRQSHGTIQKIEGVETAKSYEGVKQVTFVKEIGDSVKNINSSVDRIGYVIAQAESAVQAVNCCEMAINSISVLVK